MVSLPVPGEVRVEWTVVSKRQGKTANKEEENSFEIIEVKANRTYLNTQIHTHIHVV